MVMSEFTSKFTESVEKGMEIARQNGLPNPCPGDMFCPAVPPDLDKAGFMYGYFSELSVLILNEWKRWQVGVYHAEHEGED